MKKGGKTLAWYLTYASGRKRSVFRLCNIRFALIGMHMSCNIHNIILCSKECGKQGEQLVIHAVVCAKNHTDTISKQIRSFWKRASQYKEFFRIRSFLAGGVPPLRSSPSKTPVLRYPPVLSTSCAGRYGYHICETPLRPQRRTGGRLKLIVAGRIQACKGKSQVTSRKSGISKGAFLVL